MAHTVKTKAKSPRAAVAAKPRLGRKRSTRETAKALASMIEEHMTGLGLLEEEKNRRAARFAERVDRATAIRAKS